MNRTNLTVRLLMALTFGLVLAANRVDAVGPDPVTKPAVASLTLAAEKGLTVATPGEATWDFGDRAIRLHEVVTHSFHLRNAGAKPVTIESLLTSCHCTTATLALPPTKPGAAASDEGFTLAPGKSVEVHVAVDTAESGAGQFRKMVWVYVKGQDTAALSLTLAGSFTVR